MGRCLNELNVGGGVFFVFFINGRDIKVRSLSTSSRIHNKQLGTRLAGKSRRRQTFQKGDGSDLQSFFLCFLD